MVNKLKIWVLFEYKAISLFFIKIQGYLVPPPRKKFTECNFSADHETFIGRSEESLTASTLLHRLVQLTACII